MSNQPKLNKKQLADSKKSSRVLPRKCAVIRRSYVNGIEKTELRFVAYNRVGEGGDNQRGFLDDVDEFLQDQIRTSESTTGLETTPPPKKSPSMTVLSAASSAAVSSTHHESNCAKSQFLKRAIPSLERLVIHYQNKYNTSRNPQYQALKMAAEDVLANAQTALTTGQVPMDRLLEQIQMLNKIEQQKN